MEDQELAVTLAAAVRGDASAFAVLWRAHQPALLRYLRVIVGENAEDVASETWLQTARDLRGFSGSAAGFRVWLFTIARNRAIDERRRARRRPEEPHDLSEKDLPGRRPDVADEVVRQSETDWALSVIATLPKDQAEAVTLRIVAGLDVAQTAQVLGKRAGAVRVAAMRGLRRLAEHAEVRARWQESRRGEGV
ncbi:RNA polymerase sigma factor [Phytohabitans houttuyneae]|uniref:RNA polymerase sigma24 factor n=1 Tax=Phytohabitans houttuyneae TaxID=1076126 RepID=A0A6V8KM64_9ACTN|nr:RNA polymerase sigma factor [Phytohabitans houttuyneae]GFJ83299.1 RNA polymerase sigma24 factor [Phytohabitans houttuyneae]